MNDISQFSARLRAATREAHRGLDHHPLLAPLVRTDLTPDDYAHALAALHGAHGALERALAGFAPHADFPPRLPDLDADLAELGVTPCALRVPVPAGGTAARRLGLMYVVEGSNAGAVVIARCLGQSLPPGMPRRFFQASGGQARWEGFWRFAAADCREDGLQDATGAACEAFAFYRMHLDDCLLQMG